MSTEQIKQIRKEFDRIVNLAELDRAAALDQLASDDPLLRDEVLRLLDADSGNRATGEPERQLREEFAAVSGNGLPLPSGTRIAHYTLVSVLGEGGMGTVYRAEQDKPHRLVALKLIRPGHMTSDLQRRFEFEAEILGRLDHRGIAKIYEADIAETSLGRQPFFAMELVAGKRLDEHAGSEKLTTKQRLALLIEICQAVQHAHNKGVIHRDLKPSNILVTAEGQPKILDFGVARATDSDLQTVGPNTLSGQLIGTLPYMSPEQASGDAKKLDTASDVYALGVIAYELLSGRLPHEVSGKPLDEAVHMIRKDEPSRLSSIDRSLRGDVETIVQKALAKEKTRRYQTAGELATDVKHYLDYEPITARPPGTWYQIRKFARRNKLVVSGVALLVVVLAAGAVTSAWFAIRATRQEREAKNQAEIAQAVSDFLTKRVLSGASPELLPDKAVRDAIVKAMLDPAAVAVAQDFTNKPLTEAAVRNSLALSYQAIGRADLGLAHAQAALALRRRMLGDDHPDTLTSMDNMGNLLRTQGKLAEAEPLYREALGRCGRVLGADHPDTLRSMNSMGHLLLSQGKQDQAEALLREALGRYRRVLGNDHPDTLASIINMGGVLALQGKLPEAEPLLREALERNRRVLGNDHPNTLFAISSMGFLLEAEGKFAEAEPLSREALERRRRVLGDDHPDTLGSINNLGVVLQRQGKLAEAEPLWREGLERFRRVMGNDHPDTLTAINNMGNLLLSQDKLDQAEPLFRETLERSRRVLGDDHPDTLRAINNMGYLLQRRGKLDQAEPLFAELYRAVPGAQVAPQNAAIFMAKYGPCLVKLRRYEQANQPLREAHRRLRETEQEKSGSMRDVVAALAEVCDHTNRPDEAAKWRAELAALEAATQPTTRPATLVPATAPSR